MRTLTRAAEALEAASEVIQEADGRDAKQWFLGQLTDQELAALHAALEKDDQEAVRTIVRQFFRRYGDDGGIGEATE